MGKTRKRATVGELLRAAREAAKLNQTELAERAGLTQDRISLIETDASDPKASTIRKLADALGVEPGELI
ncbi:MAG TPA: helix-turn-helix transcriptional regulator [Candidatus Paceibacterota bacterium]|nr:helix-turn-helix transcriptional regulator [Candidatus Paceibacterota bacterium]